MDQTQMIIDPDVLERVRVFIEGYATKQKAVLTNLNTSVRALSGDWSDERTYEEMYREVETVCKNSIELFEQMRIVYKKFYQDEIMSIKKTLASLKV